MKIPNLILGVIVIIIAGFFYAMTFDFPNLNTNDTGPAFLPRIYCGLLVLFGVILFIQGMRDKKEQEEKEKTLGYALASMGIVLVYIIVMPIIGFYIATVLMILGLLMFSKVRSKVILVTIPLGTVLFIFIVFVKLLKVSIPVGTLFS